MSKKICIFEKICIFFSFCLIFSGIYLYIGENNIMNPVDDVNVISGEDKIKITDKGEENSSTSEEGSVDTSDSNANTDHNTQTIPEVNNPSTNHSENNNGSGNSNITPGNGTSGDDGSISTPTVEQTNDTSRKSLEQNYGITVKYGSEITGYTVGGMSTVGISEASDVTYALDALKQNLAKYPTGFFKEFSRAGMSLSVYLIYSFSDDLVTGVTDSSYNNVVISIATKYPFSDSFNHEAYHYMEKFIEVRGGSFNSWNLLNPVNFTYGKIDSNLSYDRTLIANSYFVNNYAQTDADEDRASTFEYMMAEVRCKCLADGLPIWEKAKKMADVIDLFFNTVNSSTVEYWERFI